MTKDSSRKQRKPAVLWKLEMGAFFMEAKNMDGIPEEMKELQEGAAPQTGTDLESKNSEGDKTSMLSIKK